MQTARDVLTPDALAMLQEIARTGSFAGAAREMGMVPSALTYRVRQIEERIKKRLRDFLVKEIPDINAADVRFGRGDFE